MKRHLLLGRKATTNLDSILKSRDITLPTKVHIVKAMVFPVVMYGCESWTIKKAEHQRIDAFELWCCRRLSQSLGQQEIKPVNPKGNQPWIFIARTDDEASIFWLPVAKTWLIGKYSDAGKDWGQEGKGATEDEMFGWHSDSVDMSLSKLREIVRDREAWCAQFMESWRVGDKLRTEQRTTTAISTSAINQMSTLSLGLVFHFSIMSHSQFVYPWAQSTRLWYSGSASPLLFFIK